jgi:hypothetical protein
VSAALVQEIETPAQEFERLTLEYMTAPEVDTRTGCSAKAEAWNLIADWALENRDLVLAAMQEGRQLALLASYIGLVEDACDGLNFVPQAVVKRGAQYIAPSPPDSMTESMFQQVLEAEAVRNDLANPATARGMRLDLERRRAILASQRRREIKMAEEAASAKGKRS